MNQADIKTKHCSELAHHVHQGAAWLSVSAEGENTAALSYAAFELRLAVERLAVHYWAVLLKQSSEEKDLRDIESFKQVERRIYQLAGHQKQIDGHFAFMRIVLSTLKFDFPLHSPWIGDLSKYWHQCSELCHIGWPLSCAVLEVRKVGFTTLTDIESSLLTQVQSLGWPILNDAKFAELRNRFVAGEATTDDILAYVQQTGLWACVEFPNGREPQFVGVPVPPQTQSDTKLA